MSAYFLKHHPYLNSYHHIILIIKKAEPKSSFFSYLMIIKHLFDNALVQPQLMPGTDF